MNYASFCVFDFETAGKNPNTCVPLFVAAKVFGARNLEPVPGGEFMSLMRPRPGELEALNADEVKESLEINKIKPEDYETAPERIHVWKQFADFLSKHNRRPGDTFNAPIPCGINIKGFDLIIVERLCRECGMLDKEGRPNLFNRRFQLDLLDVCLLWFETQKEMSRYSMDFLREKFGMSKDGAHQANMVDVEQEATLVMRFLKLHRRLTKNVVWPWKQLEAAA